MTVPAKYGIYNVGLGAALIGGITRQSIVTKSEVRGEANSGEVYRRFVAMYSQGIAPSFTTNSIAAALSACGLLGGNIAAMSGGLAVYAQKHVDGGTRASGSVHHKYAMARGLLAPRRLTIEHRGDATLEFEAAITWDGINDPLVITATAALPAAAADAGRWTLGPATLGGIPLPAKTQVSIDFGIDIVGESADSELYDTLASIRAIHSSMSFRGKNPAWLGDAAIPLQGLACTHANTAIYLRKRAPGGTFVADGTAAHIKFTAAGMAAIDNALDGQQQNAAECGVLLACSFDGTNAPIIATLGSAIA